MMRPSKRLLLLTHNYPRWEGDYAGVFLQSLCTQFAVDEIETLVLAPHAAGAPRREELGNISIQRFRYGPASFETLAYTGNMHKLVASPLGMLKFLVYLWSNFWTALFAVWRFRPRVIFAQWLAPSGLIGWLVSLLTGKPLFVTSHGTDIVLLQSSGIGRWLARLVYGRARKVFAVSNFLREQIVGQGVVFEGKAEVLPMPAQIDLFQPANLTLQGPPLILCVARFTKQKQLPVLFAALKQLVDQQISFRAEIYGEGEIESELRAELAALDFTEQVHLKKPVSQKELAKLYSQATVTVLPSINEGFGLTLVEAQLCGSAVVGANSGGITDIIESDRTGLLFTPGDSNELARHLKTLLTDSALHQRLAEQGRQQALGRFSPAAIASRYREALGF
jgi:glycosyltransferase involved in cell wall biosynthesis